VYVMSWYPQHESRDQLCVGIGEWQEHGRRGTWRSRAHHDYLESSDNDEHLRKRQTNQQEHQHPPEALTSVQLQAVSQSTQHHRHTTGRTAWEDEHRSPGTYQILIADNRQLEPLPIPPSHTPGALCQITRTHLHPIPSAQNSSAFMRSLRYSRTRPISSVSVNSDLYECVAARF
jgi:hypothetical protein